MLNFNSGSYHFPDDLELSFNLPYINAKLNKTSLRPHRNRAGNNLIWKVETGDRIYKQLNFKPSFNSSLPPKTILLEQGAGGWGVEPGNAMFVKEDCNVQHCEIIDYPPEKGVVDARMFKEIELGGYNINNLVKKTPRDPEQIWIMFALESPLASPEYTGVDHVVNWTATYRPDSTLVTPYDKWLPFGNCSKIESVKLSKNYAKGKTKMAAIFVSNCGASNKRMEYVQELKKYVEVDVYGACGDRECEKNNQQGCFDMLRKDYKFYLAFENTNCRHYITEKLFLNALRHDVVPVVMGAHPVDYARAAPPGSYIHVDDFETPQHLAQHLKKLDKNDELYNKYFRWQSCGRFINTKFWCRICAMLWDPNRPRLSVPSLEKFWRRNNTCVNDKKWEDVDFSE